MATHSGYVVSVLTDQLGFPPRPVGTVVTNLYDPAQQGYPGPTLFNPALGSLGNRVSGGNVFPSGGSTRLGGEMPIIGLDWFEKVHVIPKRQDFGNILSQQDVEIEIYNSYRKENRILSGISIPVSGLEFIDDPPLPFTIFEQFGIIMTLRALVDGPPSFDDYITFTTDEGDIEFPITGTRVVMFPFQPETPIEETLAFLTDIIEGQNGMEQRIALRKNPRQELEVTYILEDDGAERTRMENLIFDWQARNWGVPVWFESTKATADITLGDTVINVESTAYASYRVGGLVVIIKDDATFDALEIASFTSTTITLASPVNNSYTAAEVRVYPVRVCQMRDKEGGERFQVNAVRYRFRFSSVDNREDIASTAGYNTFNSKVIFDGANLIDGSHQVAFERNIEIVDGVTGKREQFSAWSRGKKGSIKGFAVTSRASLWALRQVLHSLRGRQTSFYLPTFQKDLKPVATLANGTSSLDIEHVYYNLFVRERNYLKRIRVHLINGTTIDRTITGSAAISATVERLTLNTTWASNYTVEDVARIEFIQLVRFDTDKFKIEHYDSNGNAQLFAPVKTVHDE